MSSAGAFLDVAAEGAGGGEGGGWRRVAGAPVLGRGWG